MQHRNFSRFPTCVMTSSTLCSLGSFSAIIDETRTEAAEAQDWDICSETASKNSSTSSYVNFKSQNSLKNELKIDFHISTTILLTVSKQLAVLVDKDCFDASFKISSPFGSIRASKMLLARFSWLEKVL